MWSLDKFAKSLAEGAGAPETCNDDDVGWVQLQEAMQAIYFLKFSSHSAQGGEISILASLDTASF